MLDRVDLGVTVLDGRRPHQVGDLVHARPQLGRTAQVDALEHDAVVRRRGFHGQGDRLARVQRIALD